MIYYFILQLNYLAMRKLFVVIVVLSLSIGAKCQEEKEVIYPNYAFVGGEMDYVLFPQDANGNVTFTDTIYCNFTKEQIANKLSVLLYDFEHFEKIDIDDLFSIDGALRFNVELGAGEAYVDVPYVGLVLRNGSEVEFSVSISYEDSILIYKLHNFETHRRRISGEAKETGKPNYIHWQRVNALRHESLEYKDKKSQRAKENYQEKITQIEREENQYQAEYDSVMGFINNIVKAVAE